MVDDMEKNGASPNSPVAPPRTRHWIPPWARRAIHIALLLFLVIWTGKNAKFGIQRVQDISSPVVTSQRSRALKILEKHPLIDGHNDLAILIRETFGNAINSKNFTEPFENGGLVGHVDLPRIDAGRYGGAFWSAFWLCPANPFDFSDEAYEPIVRATLHQIDILRRLSATYPHYLPSTTTSKAALSAFRKHGTRIAPLAIEGLHQVGNSYANLRLFYALGVRYATLNWNCHNIYSDAAVITFLLNGTSIPAIPLHGGVSVRGREMIREMNRLGMIVDLAHVSPDTMRDVLIGEHNPAIPIEESWNGSVAPPIISHSSAYAICPHPRNVPDDILPLVKRRGSVIMVNFSPGFVSCHLPEGADPTVTLPTEDPDGATLEKVADHIMHIGKAIGFEHVGIGSDFDGIETTPKGLEGVDKLPDLVAELLTRGVSEKEVIGVVGGNVLRVWAEVEKVSAKMQKDGVLPAEDVLPALRG